MTAPELHLPDLPEVPVTLGPAATATTTTSQRLPWAARVRQALAGYLPLLLMLLLALSTWWLVKHTPQVQVPSGQGEVRHDPDYTMRNFSITRFAPDGRMKVRVEGDVMRHYPDTDRVEIDAVRIQAVGVDGRTTHAVAQRALANGDASEVQLLGGARIEADAPGGTRVEMQSEFLHAFLALEQVRTHLPVLVRQGGNEARAGGLRYDNLSQQLLLNGPVHAVFQSGPRR